MLWVLTLHIIALLFWCATLLYLPALVPLAATRREAEAPVPPEEDGLPRILYTHVATPAALLAIASGTLVFLLQRQAELWLISKLTLVSALVVTHVLTGALIIRGEQLKSEGVRLRLWAYLLVAVQCLLMLGILWVVLAKPILQVFPWGH